jgi:regulator of sirC expression with transglutaminase-like and TPR domain
VPRKCSVCAHEQRVEIDIALVSGEPYRDIARRYRVSKDALTRHKAEHLPAALLKAQAVEEVAHADTVLDQIRAIAARTERLYAVSENILSKAYQADDLRTALGAIREANSCNKEARNNLELLAELTRELDRSASVSVTIKPEWLTLRTAILTVLTSHPEARSAVLTAITEVDSHAGN